MRVLREGADRRPGTAPVYVLRAGEARVAIAPAHGCLIHELDDGAGDVLWADGRPPRVLDPSPVVGEESAREFDEDILLGGWFPMFPAAGVPTATTQQHGWAPRVPWAVVEHTETRVTCTAAGPFLDGGVAELTRSVELEARALTVSTTVRNAGVDAGAFTWGEHPCFSRERFATGRAVFEGEPVAAVPARADGAAGHLARSARGASAAVVGPRGAVTLTDAAGTLPHWLLWFNHASAELPRADTLAWEPSTAAGLGVGDALAAGAVERLGAGDVFHAVVRCEWTLSTIGS
ncbi:hypothetical protein [Microbacterium sp. NPDC055599]